MMMTMMSYKNFNVHVAPSIIFNHAMTEILKQPLKAIPLHSTSKILHHPYMYIPNAKALYSSLQPHPTNFTCWLSPTSPPNAAASAAHTQPAHPAPPAP